MDLAEKLRITPATGEASRLMEEAANEIERLRSALQPFGDVGAWLFTRPQVPDSTPMIDLHGLNGQIGALTRGDFKAASLALRPNLN